MSCQICGRSSCTTCFHSLEEQEEFTNKFEKYLDEIAEFKEERTKLNKKICLMGKYISNEDYEKIEQELDEN